MSSKVSNSSIRTIVVGSLDIPPFDKRFDSDRRVYSPDGIAPACHTCGGGGQHPKILIEL